MAGRGWLTRAGPALVVTAPMAVGGAAGVGASAAAAAAGTVATVAGGVAASAELGLPEAAVTDPAGDVLIADTGSNRIREVAG